MATDSIFDIFAYEKLPQRCILSKAPVDATKPVEAVLMLKNQEKGVPLTALSLNPSIGVVTVNTSQSFDPAQVDCIRIKYEPRV